MRSIWRWGVLTAFCGLPAIAHAEAAKAPTIPTVGDKTDVKADLLKVCDQANKAAADLKAAGEEYVALIAANGGTPSAAASAKDRRINNCP